MNLSERKGPCLEKRIIASKRIDDYILKKRRSKVYKIWNVQLEARWGVRFVDSPRKLYDAA